MDVHPVADLFPMLSQDELEELAFDIEQRGLLHPIVLDAEGRILDGRNRFAACVMAGVEPAFITYEGADPAGYALAVNIARRHLTTGARAILFEQGQRISGSRSATDDPKLSKHRLYEAALVLDWAPHRAPAIIDGHDALSSAVEEARHLKAVDDERKKKEVRLRADAPDLLALVGEGRMSLDEALGAMEARETKARQEAEARASEKERQRKQREQERRESLDRDRERIRRVITGWGSVELVIREPDSPRVKEILAELGPGDREELIKILTFMNGRTL